MPLRRFSLLFLACLSASRAQLKRQRVGELEPALGGMQGSACSQGDGGPTEEPLVLLPWALLLALAGSLVIYLLFAKVPGAEDAGADPDAQLEETLLRDVSGVLHIIRLRLWKIVRDRRKHQQLLHESH